MNPIFSYRFSDLSVIKNIIVPSVVIVPAFINVILTHLNRFSSTAMAAMANVDVADLEKKYQNAKE